MDKDKKSEIHITNNFNAPIGQHIDHVDTINFSMDGEGNFQFGMVDSVNKQNDAGVQDNSEELFHFVHPEVDDGEARRIHESIKRLVKNHKVPEICTFLKELKDNKKILLPSTSDTMYEELVRLGMPTGEGFSKRHFGNNYIKK